MARLAVVVFNLGGPDSPDAVQPFLFNLFHDPAIIGIPQPLRWLLARLISRRRAQTAQEIYSHLGGKSPLLEFTQAQSDALAEELSGGDDVVKVFVCMRYWHPMADAVAASVQAYAPDEIVLLPLYPQFSTTTVGSSLKDWHRAATKAGLSAPTSAACCYPIDKGWIAAQADLVGQAVADVPDDVRVLFSAHGLPRKVVDGGVEVVDSHTVKLNLPAPDISLIAGMADYPAAIVHSSFTAETALSNPIGTGPYKPESLEVGVKAVLVRNEDHKWWNEGNGAWIDRFEYIDFNL